MTSELFMLQSHKFQFMSICDSLQKLLQKGGRLFKPKLIMSSSNVGNFILKSCSKKYQFPPFFKTIKIMEIWSNREILNFQPLRTFHYDFKMSKIHLILFLVVLLRNYSCLIWLHFHRNHSNRQKRGTGSHFLCQICRVV